MTIQEVELAYQDIALHVSECQPLIIIVHDESHAKHILEQLIAKHCKMHNIRMIPIVTDDTWVRDYGPIATVNNAEIQLNNFQFDGWGKKFPFYNDNLVTEQLCLKVLQKNYTNKSHGLVLEGGNLDTDGLGTLLTTKRCLLNKSRNPNMKQAQIEDVLKTQLHIKKILWLEHGYLEGDDTDGHVDILARFCSPEIICYTSPIGGGDKQELELVAMEKQLRTFTNYQGQPYELIPLPHPKPIINNDGKRLPASYTNFLILKNDVLAPIYDDPADDLALQRLAYCFPERKIIPINSLSLIEQGGAIHCATMNVLSAEETFQPIE